jgi:hypothetical protein
MTMSQLCGTTVIPDANDAGLIDSVLAAGTKSGYTYTYSVAASDANGDVTNFTLNADPVLPGQSGTQHYYTDQTSVIHQNGTVSAGAGDPPI